VEGACKSVGYDVVVTTETRSAASDLAFLSAGAIILKGKNHPVGIHVLVGGPEVALSPSFTALEAEHENLIAVLTSGAEIGPALARCRELCHEVEPGLSEFYRLVAERRENFAPAPTPAAATPDRTARMVQAGE